MNIETKPTLLSRLPGVILFLLGFGLLISALFGVQHTLDLEKQEKHDRYVSRLAALDRAIIATNVCIAFLVTGRNSPEAKPELHDQLDYQIVWFSETLKKLETERVKLMAENTEFTALAK